MSIFQACNICFCTGNDNIHYVSSDGAHELRVELEDWNGQTAYAEYSTFSVGDESSKYVLTVSGYSGTAGNDIIDDQDILQSHYNT